MKKLMIHTVLVLSLSYPVIGMGGICEIANSGVSKITATLTVSGAAAGAGLKVAGVSAVAHSSGATILTASSGYIAGTLGVVGAIGSAVTAPVTLAVGGITIVGAGGVALYCVYTD